MQEPSDVKAQLNEEVVLNCSTKAFPEATTKWLQLGKDSKCLVNLQEFKKILKFTTFLPRAETITRTYDRSVVKFVLEKERNSLYKCVSTNVVGSIEKTVSVDYYGE